MQRITQPFPSSRTPRQRGVSLLESLIALAICVLGIMGILGMQMRTLTDSQTATRRAQAIRLIEDLSERMRVNPNALAHINSYVSDFDDEPDTSNCDGNLSPEELAACDVGIWKQSVANNLPRGSQASVFIAPWENAAAPTQVGVMVSWRANEVVEKDEDDPESLKYLDNIDATKVRNDDNELISATGEDGIECPEDRICHLQYITVAARCALNDDGNTYCPGS